MKRTRKQGLVRADSRSGSGLGHASRALAISHMLATEFDLSYISEVLPESFLRSLDDIGVSFIQFPQEFNPFELELSQEVVFNADFIILDGYNFDLEYQRIAKKLGMSVVLIDDFVSNNICVDAIVNHAPGITEKEFVSGDDALICTGLDYALLQPSFLEKARNTRDPKDLPERKGIFLCMGSLDPADITYATVFALLENTDEVINCVVGNNYENLEGLRELADQKGKRLKIHKGLNHSEIAELMGVSKIGITCSSTIALEACACRLPLITGWAVDNQVLIYQGLIEKGMALPIGLLEKRNTSKMIDQALSLLFDSVVRKTIINNQTILLDGYSGKRIRETIRAIV